MSPINVTYTPQVSGDHVICYQQTFPTNDLTNFCCMLNTATHTPGSPIVFQIPDVENPDCNAGGTVTPYGGATETIFNGYVYPICNPELKTYWAAPVTFIP